ncbi:STAS domain-containing protein [Micromonospora sp. ZYX-F-536]|uniref:STAS domain-containing protein n=1 Tax=Micromonospora sp. ZYX-F-536 TaxID=3457629 RepID=UPI004040988F
MSLALGDLPDEGGRARLIAVAGEIDMSNTHLLVAFVNLATEHQPTQVMLDLSGVTFFGADGVRVLQKAEDLVTRTGGRLTIRDMTPGVRFVLAATGLGTRFLEAASTPATTPVRQSSPPAAGPSVPAARRHRQQAGGRSRGPRLVCHRTRTLR